MQNRPSAVAKTVSRFGAVDDAVRAGRWLAAEAAIREMLSHEPEDAQLWNRLGNALWGQMRIDEAAAAYYRALSLDPSWSEALANLVQALFRLQRIEEAVATCAVAAHAEPNSYTAHYYLGLALVQQRRHRAAAGALKEAVRLKPDSADAFYALGDSLLETDKEDAAADALRAAVKLRPDFADALIGLGRIAYGHGSLAEAEDYLRRAISASPDAATAHYYLGLALRRGEKTAESIAAFQRAVASSPRWIEAHIELAYALASYGRTQAAEAEAREAVSLEPSFFPSQLALTSILVQTRRYAEAEAVAREAARLAPEDAGIHSRLAEILFHQEKRDEAEAEANTALRLDDSLPYPHYLLGVVCIDRGEREQGLEHFRRYMDSSPDDTMGVGLYLAHLGIAIAPERAPDNYLGRLYHSRATYWDQTTASERPYRGADMVANALARLKEGATQKMSILDAGCGTGLVGILVRERATRLDGVDLSAPMLEKASNKKIYDSLAQGDLVAYMESKPRAYDAITSAATLIHIGDLRPVFAAAARALRSEGLFIFTLFPYDEGEGVTVNSYSCYSHSLGYVREQAAAAGFAVELAEKDIHEYNGETPVMAWIIALRLKAGAKAADGA